MKISGPVLFDTNILVYALDEKAVKHPIAKTLVQRAVDREIQGYISTQNLYEFFAVVTHPQKVPSPLNTRQGLEAVKTYLEMPLRRISPGLRTHEKALTLALEAGLTRQRIFDAVLAATMIENGVNQILTDNEIDFTKFSEVSPLNPFK